jgi:hypothetical protein
VAEGYQADAVDHITRNLMFAVQTLFVEGAIEELAGL